MIKELIKIPYSPFLIFMGNKNRILFGVLIVVLQLWLIDFLFGLRWSPDIDAYVNSGAFLLNDVYLGTKTVGSLEWYLRVTLGYMFFIFHWWLHISLVFTGFMYAMKQEIEMNPTKKHHSYIILSFVGIFPLAWYFLICQLIGNIIKVVHTIM